MAIIDDYGTIAKRMRELKPAARKGQAPEREQWRDAVLDVAREYVRQRRTETAWNRILPRRPQPTD